MKNKTPTTLPTGAYETVGKSIPPSWLKKRMKALRQLPPPTLTEVELSFRSSAEARQKYMPKARNYIAGR